MAHVKKLNLLMYEGKLIKRQSLFAGSSPALAKKLHYGKVAELVDAIDIENQY